MIEFNAAAVIGSLVMGALLGLIPGIVGYRKGKQGLALGGFFACVAGSFLLGLFLSVPLCIIFTTVILVSGRGSSRSGSPSPGQGGGTCAQCGAPLAPGQPFCARCGMRQQGTAAPGRCPACGGEISPDTIFCGNCGAKVR